MLWGCSVIGNPPNEKDWPAVKTIIESDPNIHQKKRMYLIDRIDEIIKKNTPITFEAHSFSDLIDFYSLQYDSLNTLYASIRQTNAILDEILELDKAESISLDSDRGFIIFTLNFNQVFEDSIDYMILTYQYVDDYDNLYFSENSKLSYQAAGKFEGTMQSIMTDIFNGENEIIYLKTDLSATEVLQKNYGIDSLTASKEREYLKDGLKVRVSVVKFDDGGFMKRRNGNWKYFE